MSNMLGATQGAWPIMEYVHRLENRVRMYQASERKWRVGTFVLGMGAGAGLGFWLRGLLRL